ncbi:threonine/serine exporter family protein [Cruoricaptor ignavus]|nr:hypothetical protein [Cruoricaptor ignavus]
MQAAAHGVAQGTLSLMQGASFKQAFIAGALGSLGASAWGYALNKVGLSQFASSSVGTIAFGALSGGVGSALSGGNFWQGALIGGVVAGLNHVAHAISEPGVDKDTRRTFRKLVKNDDYQGAFDLVNSKYNLDAGIEGKYTLTFSDDYSYSGLTGGEAYGMQEVTIAKHVFRGPVATFARVVHHEFVHVYQRAILGMTGNLSIYQVREFLGYHDSLFNKNLPKASFSSMEGYWNKAREFYNYMTAHPALIRAYQSQYNDFANSSFFK